MKDAAAAPLRFAGAVGLLALGGVTGVAAVAAHTLWWGLPLTAAAMATLHVALGPGWLTRLPPALGFGVVVGGAVPPRSEGDYLIAADPPGLLLLALTFVVLLAALATLPRPRRPARPTGVPESGSGDLTTYHGARD